MRTPAKGEADYREGSEVWIVEPAPDDIEGFEVAAYQVARITKKFIFVTRVRAKVEVTWKFPRQTWKAWPTRAAAIEAELDRLRSLRDTSRSRAEMYEEDMARVAQLRSGPVAAPGQP